MPTVCLCKISPSGARETFEVSLGERPSVADVLAVVEPHLDGGRAQRVLILKPGSDEEIASMFIDEEHVNKQLPRNEEATTLYRRAWLVVHPEADPETLPWIAGNVVIADRRLLDY